MAIMCEPLLAPALLLVEFEWFQQEVLSSELEARLEAESWRSLLMEHLLFPCHSHSQ